MYVVLRKAHENKNWNVHAATATEESAIVIVERTIKDGWECKYYKAGIVYIAENGNHAWTG